MCAVVAAGALASVEVAAFLFHFAAVTAAAFEFVAVAAAMEGAMVSLQHFEVPSHHRHLAPVLLSEQVVFAQFAALIRSHHQILQP